MKKMLSLFLVLLLVCTAAFAEGLDFPAMTEEELHEIISAARNELTKRELVASEKLVIFEAEGVQVYLTGEHRVYGTDTVFLDLEAVVINDSDVPVSLSTAACSVNGWNVWNMGISSTSVGKKQKGNFNINLTDAEISSYEEIEEIEFSLYLVNAETYQRVGEEVNVIVHFNAE